MVYARILGFEEQEIKLDAKDFHKNFIHPDDLKDVLLALEDYFNKKKRDCSATFRIYTKDGKLKKVESKGEIFQYDAFNNPLVIFGFIVEV